LGTELGELAMCANYSGIATAWCWRRTRLMNELRAVALSEGVRRQKGFWRREHTAQDNSDQPLEAKIDQYIGPSEDI
jgi:hypothetical protein